MKYEGINNEFTITDCLPIKGKFYNIKICFDGKDKKTYIDGVLVSVNGKVVDDGNN